MLAHALQGLASALGNNLVQIALQCGIQWAVGQ
jgi:hypothetical protein